MEEITTLLTSINEHLGLLVETVANKKKKSDTKKEEEKKFKKRNIYTKKKDGSLEINPIIEKALDSEQKLFLNQMIERYPNISKMDEPLTLEQYKKLVLRYTLHNVIFVMAQLDNSHSIRKYISAYKTLDNWLLKAEGNMR